MTALAANKIRQTKDLDGPAKAYPVAATTTIFAGGLVMIDSDGYAVPAAAAAGNKGVAGYATEKVVNSGSAGAKWVLVQAGKILMPAASITQAMVGDVMYAQDDNQFDETQGANEPIAGVLVEFVTTTSGWLQAGPLEFARSLVDTDT